MSKTANSTIVRRGALHASPPARAGADQDFIAGADVDTISKARIPETESACPRLARDNRLDSSSEKDANHVKGNPNGKKLRRSLKQNTALRKKLKRASIERDRLVDQLRQKDEKESRIRLVLRHHRIMTLPMAAAAKASSVCALVVLPVGSDLWFVSCGTAVVTGVATAYVAPPYVKHWWNETIKPAYWRVRRIADPVPPETDAEPAKSLDSALQLHALPDRKARVDASTPAS